ncbi:MAG TPA: S53 family peptidase [Terriglobales bacterium]|nr:S53 family peptidase [Terriglobales bacterium]
MFASRNLQNLLFSAVKCSAVALLLASSLFSTAQDKLRAGSPSIAARVQNVDENELVLLQGNTHPLARPEFDQGAASDDLPMEHMFLLLQRSPRQEQALERFMAEQLDPHSPNYHHWLTAEQLGRNFGPAQQDIAAVVRWLESHGMRVNRVYPSAMVIDISATAGQVRDTFHAEIHRYNIDGQTHIANASDPAIPAGLAPVVAGVASLTDFRPKAMAHRPSPDFSVLCKGCPGLNNVEFYIEGPPDFATIYNVNPLYQAKITGKGQRIAVLEDTDIIANDWYIFRYAFGLSSYSGTFAQKHPAPPSGPDNCAVPPTNSDEFEAALDAEWSGAVAPDADIELASCADTATTFGGDMAAYNLINSKTPPPIISYSYGECEADLGISANEFYYIAWQQAAAEGTSMFVAAGDWSAAVCNASFSSGVFATAGISVNGLASTPYNLAAGGTDFSDYVTGTLNLYWNKKNGPRRGSAKSYIPEMTWNQSCAGSVLFHFFGYTSGLDFCNSSIGSTDFIDIVAGSGGPSFVYPKPSWQSVFGNPDDHKRDLPDVSLFSSIAFWYQDLALCMSDTQQGGAPCNYDNPEDALFFNSGGGTSFASPQLAGVQALINQKKGGSQGNAAPIYYRLAVVEYGSTNHPNDSTLQKCNANRGNKVGTSCIFHDVTLGNSDVPCYGTVNCYDPAGGSAYGVLSTSDTSLEVAYPATPGWDFSTGLGSVNVANVVNAWP